MDFVLAIIKVVVGAFLLFYIARMVYLKIGKTHSLWWTMLVGVLTLANMLIYRVMGGAISPPFYTAVLFGITLNGLAQQAGIPTNVMKRAYLFLVIGMVGGWLTFAEIH